MLLRGNLFDIGRTKFLQKFPQELPDYRQMLGALMLREGKDPVSQQGVQEISGLEILL